jgi:hypothetical protein
VGDCENELGAVCVILKEMASTRTGEGTSGGREMRLWAAWVAMWAFAMCLHAQGTAASAALLSVPPKQWAAEAALNELKVINYEHSYLRYREHTVDAKGDHLRDVIETKDGTVARMIMKDGRPLTPEEDQWEHERLQAMLDSPSAFAKHMKNDSSGKKMGADMIKLMADAMVYTYTPGQPQRPDRTVHGDDLPEIVLDYKPNPSWTPPNMTADALTGLEGRVWIDAKTHYLTRMEGTVFRPVNFGLFLAHIYPGGKLTFDQVRVGEQRWIFSRFTEHVDVRVLVKTLKESTEIEAASFSVVPEMSYQDAIRMLWATPLPK